MAVIEWVDYIIAKEAVYHTMHAIRELADSQLYTVHI